VLAAHQRLPASAFDHGAPLTLPFRTVGHPGWGGNRECRGGNSQRSRLGECHSSNLGECPAAAGCSRSWAPGGVGRRALLCSLLCCTCLCTVCAGHDNERAQGLMLLAVGLVAVPSPRHKYVDQKSGLTEIYLPTGIYVLRCRY
jgi:hypothetical protein